MFIFLIYKIVRGDLYKPDSKSIHVNGGFNLGDIAYHGRLLFERDNDRTRIELQRAIKFTKTSSTNAHEFFYEHKHTKETNQNSYNIITHLSLRTPTNDDPMKLFNLKADFARSMDASNITLQSSVDYTLLLRNPPVQERIELDYIKRRVQTSTTTRRLTSPENNLKLQIKTKSNVFNFLLDHRHRQSTEASKKGLIEFRFIRKHKIILFRTGYSSTDFRYQ